MNLIWNIEKPMQYNTFDSYIDLEKQRLIQYLTPAMTPLAQELVDYWLDKNQLNQVLWRVFSCPSALKQCQYLYLVDNSGSQISSNISPNQMDDSAYGQDLTQRPYLQTIPEQQDLWLSEMYVSKIDGKSCISAVQRIYNPQNIVLGYLIADFSLLSLPANASALADRRIWLQAKGDPAIRSTLFQQSRIQSLLDDNIDNTINIIDELMQQRGVFQAKIHFSSARITLWLYDDPYRYRVHLYREIQQACMAYPPRAYPVEAVVALEQIKTVFQNFKRLRFMDDTVYLRAGSLNLINGMISLNFSCDGTHYLPLEDFLRRPDFYLS
jgi:hypothetical protein